VSSVAAQPGCCVLVLVVYIKIKKNKLLQNCNIVHASVMRCVVVQELCCVFLRELSVSPVELYLVCCVFLLVPEV
jgi:hypothetical protein